MEIFACENTYPALKEPKAWSNKREEFEVFSSLSANKVMIGDGGRVVGKANKKEPSDGALTALSSIPCPEEAPQDLPFQFLSFLHQS